MFETNKSKFLAGWIKGIILSTQLLSFLKLRLIDKLLLKHVGLPYVLDLSVHLVTHVPQSMTAVIGWSQSL